MKIPSSSGLGGRWRMVLVDDRDEAIAEVCLDDSGGDLRVAVNGVAEELALWVDEHPEMIGG